ncbi:unnamed protein product [Effrenium voratum]|nr:unnamed protein product [Effrenium voratum]
MVHLVSERPRESVLPVLIQHCAGGTSIKKTSPKSSFWSIAFPIYYVLLSLLCNALFFVGSCLFLPIKLTERSVSFTFVIENLDVEQVMTSHITFFEDLENNFTGALASDQANPIKPHHTHFQWRKTTSCSLDNAMLFDVNIYPRDGHNVTALKMSLPSSLIISNALNRSFSSLGIGDAAVGSMDVTVVSRPRLVETPIVQKWAVDLGCNLFIIGSALLAAISGLDLLEDMLACGLKLKVPSPSGKSHSFSSHGYEMVGSDSEAFGSDAYEGVSVIASARAERGLYLTGGLIFLVGTIYFQHPQMISHRVPSEVMRDEDVLFAAIWMFILGSIIFVFATFLNALSLNVSAPGSSKKTFIHWSVATCGVYELGGILFVMGSVCFMPNQGCKEGMEILGAWCFMLGACCYVMGDFIEFMKTCALIFLRMKQEEAAQKIERAMLHYLFRQRLASVGKYRRQSRPNEQSRRSSVRSRGSVKQLGLVRTFTQALKQKSIIQALKFENVPKCAAEHDGSTELLAGTKMRL